jgi:hypothetical protein
MPFYKFLDVQKPIKEKRHNVQKNACSKIFLEFFCNAKCMMPVYIVHVQRTSLF